MQLGLPKLCWVVVARADILVFLLSQWEFFQLFTIENDVCRGFVIYSLDYVEVGSRYAHFLKGFYQKWVLDFVKDFPLLLRGSYGFYSSVC